MPENRVAECLGWIAIKRAGEQAAATGREASGNARAFGRSASREQSQTAKHRIAGLVATSSQNARLAAGAHLSKLYPWSPDGWTEMPLT